jgi:branched-chain amino acid transport system permease protein
LIVFKSLSTQSAALKAALWLCVIGLPFFATPAQIDIASQVWLAAIGAISLMLLTGYAGQISLGHSALLAAGAFSVGILTKEFSAPSWVCLILSPVIGALLGLLFGLPSLRLRGLYLAVSTLAMHVLVVYLGGEYETKRGYSTGIVVDPPSLLGFTVQTAVQWYFFLLFFAALAYLLVRNLTVGRAGRAWALLRTNETVASALGIRVDRYKLLAFVISSAMTSFAGGLFAYYRGFVSIEAFSIYLSIQYVAMIIVGGMGSLVGALLGCAFVTILPYVIEGSMAQLTFLSSQAGAIFAVNYAVFGILMIAFLIFEPQGLSGLIKRFLPKRSSD